MYNITLFSAFQHISKTPIVFLNFWGYGKKQNRDPAKRSRFWEELRRNEWEVTFHAKHKKSLRTICSPQRRCVRWTLWINPKNKNRNANQRSVCISERRSDEAGKRWLLMQSIKKSSRTSAVRDDVCFHYTIDEPIGFWAPWSLCCTNGLFIIVLFRHL